MPTGFQYACAETVEEATKVLNNAIRTARKFGAEVRLSLAYAEDAEWVKAAITLPEEPEDDEEDMLK